MVSPVPRPSIVYRPLSLSELATMAFPEREWVATDLLPRGSLTLFTAREKAGKSLLAADLAACVAAGEPFLDQAVGPGPAILVPAEENLREVQERFLTRLAGRTEVPLHVLPVNQAEDDRLDLANPAAIAALGIMIAEYEPALLVLDPFRELHGLPENDADAMGPLLRPLRRLAHEANIAIVLIHHMGHSGHFRGSTAIRASCDQEWAFRRPDESQDTGTTLQGVLRVEGRYGLRQMIGIRLGDGLHWQCAAQAAPPPPSTREQLLTYLRTTPQPATAQEIAAVIGVAAKTVQNLIAAERATGASAFLVLGSGHKSDPYRYALAPARPPLSVVPDPVALKRDRASGTIHLITDAFDRRPEADTEVPR